MDFFAKIFQTITYWPTIWILKFFLRYEVQGQENLNGLENKSFIFASNHASGVLDGPISAATMPRKHGAFCPWDFFPVHFLVYKEFFSWRNRFPFPFSVLAMLYVRANDSISIEYPAKDIGTLLAPAVSVLKNGGKIWIYPEGKKSDDGKLAKKGGRGAAYLHQQTGAVIVPVGINGTFGVTFKKIILRKLKVTVKIGEPIHFLPQATLEEDTTLIMQKIGELL